MSSFNYYARKARDPKINVWARLSALNSCIMRYCDLTHQRFPAVRERLILPLGVGRAHQNKPPSEQQLWDVVAVLETERNIFLERLRAFDRRRIREKARGKCSPAAHEFETLYRPIIPAAKATEQT